MKGEAVVQLGTGTVMYGIVHTPGHEVRDDLAFVFLNAGLIHRPGPFRLYVHIARRLAALGFLSVRLDQTGKGDSDRRTGVDAIGAVKADIDAVAGHFAATGGPRRLVLVGLCSGADDALWIARERDDIAGLVTLDGYAARTGKFHVTELQRKLRRVTPARLWRKVRNSLEPPRDAEAAGEDELVDLRNFPDEATARTLFSQFFDAQMQLCCVFTGDVRQYYNHAGQLHSFINDPRSREFVTETFLPYSRHTFPFPSQRDEITALVVDWCKTTYEARDTASAA